MIPAHSSTKGVGRPPKPPLCPYPPSCPYRKPHLRDQLTHTPTPTPHLPRGASKGTSCLFSLPLATAGAPVKPCLNFSSGLLSISTDLSPRTQITHPEDSENECGTLSGLCVSPFCWFSSLSFCSNKTVIISIAFS